MARRDGWAACVMGLHLCVLAGCLHTDATPPPAPAPADPPTARPDTRSPYALVPTDVVAGERKRVADLDKPLADTEFKQASQPKPEKPSTSEDAAPPRAPQPLPAISPPTADPVETARAPL